MMLVKNKLGGIDSTQKHELERAKKVDLVTLPKDVSGTNCYNCKFVSNKIPEKAFCQNKHVMQAVNARMCCALWDNNGVYRAFGKKAGKYD